jgi:ribosomal protein S18 acetylase RimI-like enzyme
MMQITFRPTAPSDLDFLWRLHLESMRDYVERTFGWDLEVQRGFITRAAEDEVGKILLVDDREAGFWNIVESDEEIFLNSIVLLPDFQNLGIGTKLITKLLHGSVKPVRLQVLKVNPARELYERLGFQICDDKETHYEMIYRPANQADERGV